MESPGDDPRDLPVTRRILGRIAGLRDRTAAGTKPRAPGPTEGDLASLAARVDRLETAFEGLQDSVYREAQRLEHELAELRRQVRPDQMARSLSGDARRRGL